MKKRGLLLIILLFLLISCGKKEKAEDEALLAARLSGLLTYKEMASVTPANLFVFEKFGIVLQRSTEHPFYYSYVDETNAFQIEVKFQQDEPGKWEYLKTSITMKNKNRSFFDMLIGTMEKATGIKGVESHFSNTQSYTWLITPELNASINGYDLTPGETAIKMELGFTQMDDFEVEEEPEEVSTAKP